MKLLTLVLLITCSSAWSATQTLLTITNDIDSDVTCMYVSTDKNGDIQKFVIMDCRPKHRKRAPIVIHPSQASKGVVLYRKSGHDVIKLTSRNFASHNGGHISLDYLYNGLTGSTGTVTFELSRSGDQWEVTLNHKKITKLKFFARRWFGKLVGIGGYRGN